VSSSKRSIEIDYVSCLATASNDENRGKKENLEPKSEYYIISASYFMT
jgi:hypothetical protein